MIGETFGNYRLTELIGEGGMGVVYLAEHPGIGRRAAIKILRAGLTENPDLTKRFFNEARAANADPPSRHRRGVRLRHAAVGHLVHRHGAARGREPGRPPAPASGGCRWRTRAAWPRRRRARSPPPTPPASSTAISSPTTSSSCPTTATRRGDREGAGLRHRQAEPGRRAHQLGADADRIGDGNARVHVARAVPGHARRSITAPTSTRWA